VVQQPQRNLADMPGMDVTVFEVLRSFRQAIDPPASSISTEMQVSLPIPAWAESSYLTIITANLTAGLATPITALSIPGNERAWLDGYQVTRETGDNTILAIQVLYPTPYATGDRILNLILLGTAATEIFWPDPGGAQTIDRGFPGGPLLLEPLAAVRLLPSGAGVAASTFRVEAVRRRIKLTRAQGPELIP